MVLKVGVGFAESCEIDISSPSGDVADQIFERLHSVELFKEMKLVPTSCYFIILDKALFSEFIKHVEAIDASTLKKGKSY